MVILLGSKNPSKKRSLEKALIELEIEDFDVKCIDSDSGVNSNPIGYEIIRGADNRNQQSKLYAEKHNIKYDYLYAIEGGYSLDENGLPFVITYAIVEDVNGKKSTGKSLGIRLRKDMFDYIKSGGSLNDLIEEITNQNDNKSLQGITGYLSGGLLNRDEVDKVAVVSAFVTILFKKNRDILSEKIKQKKLEKIKLSK